VVDPERIISHRFPLEKIDEAVKIMGTPHRNKVMILP
jgi:threonine dehydrogenase-like Zn-dependent dehydrogenase